MSYKKTAKDLAWDRERLKYEIELKNANAKNTELKAELSETQNKVQSLENWLERLLKFTELTPEQAEKWFKHSDERTNMANLFGFLNSNLRY